MNVLRVLTVDDEILALRRLQLLLQSIPFVEHVGEASSCKEALSSVQQLSPDAILLDIKLRDGDGFDILESLASRPNPPLIIFITAFDHYALRAFENAVVDYLLKPVERDRLAQALARARFQLRASEAEQRSSEMLEIIRNLRAAAAARHEEAPYDVEYWLRGAGGLVRVPIETIECVSSEDDYIAFHTASGSHLMRGSLRQFETHVEPGHFVRVHRRWLARKATIVELKTGRVGTAELTLKSGRKVPVGRVYMKQLRKELYRSSWGSRTEDQTLG